MKTKGGKVSSVDSVLKMYTFILNCRVSNLKFVKCRLHFSFKVFFFFWPCEVNMQLQIDIHYLSDFLEASRFRIVNGMARVQISMLNRGGHYV